MMQVRKVLIRLLPFLFSALFATEAVAEIRIFACEPEWASLAKEIAGDRADIFQATTAFQDPHHIEARPSLIAKMRKADLVICTGADLEVGWLPLLIRSAGNKKVQPTSLGYFEAAMQIERLGVPTQVDRSMGDVHVAGNPHVHLDPHRIITISQKLSVRLAEIDPKNQRWYEKNQQDFQKRLEQQLAALAPESHKIEGKSYVVYHKDWAYLFDWLKLKTHATIESKPGIPPSSSDLKRLLQVVKGQPVSGIVIAEYQNDRSAKWLSNKTGLPIIKLPYTVGGNKQAVDFPSLFKSSLELLTP